MGNNNSGIDPERAALILQIQPGVSRPRRTVHQHASLLNQQQVDRADDRPPPYSQGKDQVAPGTEMTMSGVPVGPWELACNIGVQGPFLQLDARGEPTWTQVDCAATDGKQKYRRDGFTIALGLSQIMVTKQGYNWTCDASTYAGRLLSNRDTISLRNLGQRLLVFERTVVAANRDRPKPKPREDKKGCLKVESQSSNIWVITGTDIYQVEGHGNDVVIRSPQFLRLWDMNKREFRWERTGGGGHIWGFTQNHIIRKVGKCWMHERKTGHVYGDFSLPINGLTDLNEEHHFGPVVSASGLFLYKPGRKAIFIFRIGEREVDARLWESTDDIQGSLLMRGGLDNLELELIGQKPTWTKYDETWPVYKEWDPIKRRIR
ncbi:hypothetical protein KXW98_007559 [Aspergillus fumigatus]|nr:hypothetical protein KXX63_000762 [Aspergillus fumigatus]KAH1377460.1 hypothetical protein KXX10_000389 [Aspergillus fumigatus]KAH1447008.1 hypothetical protein KXX58_006110 [Aspergillus fumigatus]KAH1508127.1 hypothetical protein KXX29_006840 [Aspergillus fumigatus]KAH1805699.1 hypothetical protein KXX19_004500 [Aspergillus fumigatus]